MYLSATVLLPLSTGYNSTVLAPCSQPPDRGMSILLAPSESPLITASHFICCQILIRLGPTVGNAAAAAVFSRGSVEGPWHQFSPWMSLKTLVGIYPQACSNSSGGSNTHGAATWGSSVPVLPPGMMLVWHLGIHDDMCPGSAPKSQWGVAVPNRGCIVGVIWEPSQPALGEGGLTMSMETRGMFSSAMSSSVDCMGVLSAGDTRAAAGPVQLGTVADCSPDTAARNSTVADTVT